MDPLNLYPLDQVFLTELEHILGGESELAKWLYPFVPTHKTLQTELARVPSGIFEEDPAESTFAFSLNPTALEPSSVHQGQTPLADATTDSQPYDQQSSNTTTPFDFNLTSESIRASALPDPVTDTPVEISSPVPKTHRTRHGSPFFYGTSANTSSAILASFLAIATAIRALSFKVFGLYSITIKCVRGEGNRGAAKRYKRCSWLGGESWKLGLGGVGLLILLILGSSAPISVRCGKYSGSTHSPSCARSNPAYSNQQATNHIDFPALMSVENSFLSFVGGAAGGTALARAITSSESAVTELSAVVKFSELNCRKPLGVKFDQFAQSAELSVLALSGWRTRFERVLDQLLSVNQYSMREMIRLRNSKERNGIVATIVHIFRRNFLLNAGLARLPTEVSPTSSQIGLIFNHAAEVLERNLQDLISDGEAIITTLEYLLALRSSISNDIKLERFDTERQKSAVLSSPLIRIFDRNQLGVKIIREKIALLNMIDDFERESVLKPLVAAIVELDRMIAGLEILRGRVAQRLLVNEDAAIRPFSADESVPALHVHIEAVEKVIEGLKSGLEGLDKSTWTIPLDGNELIGSNLPDKRKLVD